MYVSGQPFAQMRVCVCVQLASDISLSSETDRGVGKRESNRVEPVEEYDEDQKDSGFFGTAMKESARKRHDALQ